MKAIGIMAPLPIASVTTSAGAAASDPGAPATNLLTPDPREIFAQSGGGNVNIDIDLGSAQSIDTFFVGYVGNAPNAVLSISGGGNSSTDVTFLTGIQLLTSPIPNPLYRHFVVTFAAPVSVRYIRLVVNSNVNAVMTIGTIALGLRFVPQYGVEYGAGRQLTDTGNAERLFGGSFGLDPGAVIGGYSFTLGDLQTTERSALYRIVRGLGQTRSVLVLEDSDTTSPINEGVHWGLFLKLDAYERLDPLNTKWAFQITDWL